MNHAVEYDLDVAPPFDFSSGSAFHYDFSPNVDSGSVQNIHKSPTTPLWDTQRILSSFISMDDVIKHNPGLDAIPEKPILFTKIPLFQFRPCGPFRLFPSIIPMSRSFIPLLSIAPLHFVGSFPFISTFIMPATQKEREERQHDARKRRRQRRGPPAGKGRSNALADLLNHRSILEPESTRVLYERSYSNIGRDATRESVEYSPLRRVCQAPSVTGNTVAAPAPPPGPRRGAAHAAASTRHNSFCFE
ncbi:hypothetical protein EVAR_27738_1 [Eumeta japonica]|uniref:Uncharacterized protein n=1 Tax=Eumeta variegata TaxID=151549 RepID=A0A4C1V9Z4_EUMVA|nr:hypothetical protein EVAR_27738_1 [Eumeta japonica]